MIKIYDCREPPVRQHLKNVYGCLSMSMLSAAGGVYIHMFSELLRANLLTTLATLGLLFTLINTPDNGKNQKLRLSYLLGFAFFSGLGLGPLLQLVMSVNPTVIVTALIGKLLLFKFIFENVSIIIITYCDIMLWLLNHTIKLYQCLS